MLAAIPAGLDDPKLYLLALKVLEKATQDEPQLSSEVVSQLHDLLDDDRASYLVYRSLLGFTRIPGSRIVSRKGKNGGYFLVDAPVFQQDELPTQAEQKKEKTLERHLWPAVAEWLHLTKQIERVSHEVANLKSGGVWSNPDVVGFNIIEDLGFFDIEITTVEVKPSLQNWRYYFFEAVSHKRFSERVYFVYRDAGEAAIDQRLELLRYAEKYGVGVAELQLTDADFDSLKSWSAMSEDDKIEILESFVELVPAPFEAISVRDKINFLKQIGIGSKPEMYSFGS